MQPNMTEACTFLPLDGTLAVQATRAMPPLPDALEAEVEAIWAQARAARPGLFNGRVFTAENITPSGITGHWTEFRRVFAQMRAPALFGVLGLRPLAVVGVLRTPGGVLLGQRAHDAIYQPGRWQTCPAGSVESRGGEERVDLAAQILAEAEEELGLPPASVAAGAALVAVEHPRTHILDIALALETRLHLPEILTLWQNRANREYATLDVLPPDGMAAAVDDERLTEQTRLFLRHAR